MTNSERATFASPAEYAETLRRSFRWRYHNAQDVWSSEPALQQAARWIFNHLPHSTVCDVLDIGIGAATNVTPLLHAGHRVYGLDIVTPPNWPELRQRWSSQLDLIEADFLSWDARGARFDLVCDLGCLHHQLPDNYLTYLHRVRAVLQANARFGLCVYEDISPDVTAGSIQTTDHGRLAKTFVAAELLDLLSTVGLEVADTFRVMRAAALPPYLVVLAQAR
jgi:SAM-dependent methyltransferase